MYWSSFDETDTQRKEILTSRKQRFRWNWSTCGCKTSFTTYKCVVVFGSFFAISSRLLPTDVHITVSPKSPDWQVQFPATEHKNGDPEPLPLSPPLPSLLPPSPLPRSGVGRSSCEVAEMTKLHTRKWTPQNIVWCYFESKWAFGWSLTHSACFQSSIQVRPNDGTAVDILLILEYSVLCYSKQER